MGEQRVDMVDGLYRRIYACMITGKRINSVSMAAEMVFLRMHLVADDYGHLVGDADLLKGQMAPRRKDLPAEAIASAVAELQAAGLVRTYQADGEQYVEIVDWSRFQPANRSGRRVQRHPMPTSNEESGGIQRNPDESAGIQTNPGGSGSRPHQTPETSTGEPQDARGNPGESRASAGNRERSGAPHSDSDPDRHQHEQAQSDPDPDRRASQTPMWNAAETGSGRAGIAPAAPGPDRTGAEATTTPRGSPPDLLAPRPARWPDDEGDFCRRFTTAVAIRFGVKTLSTDEWQRQKRAVLANARRIAELNGRRDAVADQVLALAEEKARAPGLENRWAAWQAAVDKLLGERKAVTA